MKTRRSPVTRRRRVLIVDDHPIVRKGIAQLLAQEDDLEVCAEAEGYTDTLRAIETASPEVVLLDLSLQGAGGLDLLKTVHERRPRLPVLVVSMHDESLYAERALRAGARGYVMKHEAPDRIVAAVRRILSGGIYLSESMSSRLLARAVTPRAAASASPVSDFSDRELEIFQLIGKGVGTRQIAERLHLSIKTIETHRAHIKDKLGVATAPELVRHAVQWAQQEGR